MISRKSAKLIAESYHDVYTGQFRVRNRQGLQAATRFETKVNQLYDFFYEEEYAPYFLQMIKQLPELYQTRALKEFIMRLHTGESLAKATPEWTWENRQKLGQRYLKDLAEDFMQRHGDISGYGNENTQKTISLMKSQLELDGYIYRDSMFYQVDSSVIDEKEEQSYLELLVNKLSLSDSEVIKHHIKNAEEHYLNAKWDDSIAVNDHLRP